MTPDHAYDPVCSCNFCIITSESLWKAHPSQINVAAKKADVVPIPEKQPGEVIFINFKTRKRI